MSDTHTDLDKAQVELKQAQYHGDRSRIQRAEKRVAECLEQKRADDEKRAADKLAAEEAAKRAASEERRKRREEAERRRAELEAERRRKKSEAEALRRAQLAERTRARAEDETQPIKVPRIRQTGGGKKKIRE